MQIVGRYRQTDIALEAGPIAIRTSVQSTMLQLIDVGFYRIMPVLLPATAAPFLGMIT